MYDRRSGGSIWNRLFDANFSDLHLVEIQVNPEFGSVESAQAQAERFAPVIGRLPKCLLTDVQSVWIHMGNENRLGVEIIICSFMWDRRMIM